MVAAIKLLVGNDRDNAVARSNALVFLLINALDIFKSQLFFSGILKLSDLFLLI